MSSASPTLDIGFVAVPVDSPGTPDARLYEEIVADCQHHAALGYDTAWLIEHHFSDYFPDPNPLMMISHLAAREPDLAYGTCVLVTPWANPLRMAEDIAMLTHLCRKPLELGLGRGTATLEYDAFGIEMAEARDRFDEGYELITRALGGETFTHDGKYYPVEDPIQLRPTPAPGMVNFYGAIGSPTSAARYGAKGLPPMLPSGVPDAVTRKTIARWREAAEAHGHSPDVSIPMQVMTVVEDTDEKALEMAQQYLPLFGQAQVDHYRIDSTDWESIPGYESFAKAFAAIKRLSDPEHIPNVAPNVFVGSPDTIARRFQELVDMGIDKVMVFTATPGVPREVRHRWAERFAKDVAPAFSRRFRTGA